MTRRQTRLPDGVTPARSASMRRVRQRDTPAEMAVRRALHSLGARFRVNVRGLPGSPDIANRSRKKAVFVHGCFWHRHPGCRRATTPRKNEDFWIAKFEANVDRDRRKASELRDLGYDVLTVWECEAESESLFERLQAFWFGSGGD